MNQRILAGAAFAVAVSLSWTAPVVAAGIVLLRRRRPGEPGLA